MGWLRFFPGALPPLWVRCCNREIVAIRWETERHTPRRTPELSAQRREEKALLDEVASDLVRYFGGERVTFFWPLKESLGTPFQRTVWQALRKIPYGETRSYCQLAQTIGKLKSARAVGQANKQNPFPLAIPCHRVISQDGDIGGYAAGVEIKRRLLCLERSFP